MSEIFFSLLSMEKKNCKKKTPSSNPLEGRYMVSGLFRFNCKNNTVQHNNILRKSCKFRCLAALIAER